MACQHAVTPCPRLSIVMEVTHSRNACYPEGGSCNLMVEVSMTLGLGSEKAMDHCWLGAQEVNCCGRPPNNA